MDDLVEPNAVRGPELRAFLIDELPDLGFDLRAQRGRHVVGVLAELLAAGITGPEGHHESRPPAVEAEGVHHLMTFAEMTGAATYIVHLSCEEALRQAIAARERGVRVSVDAGVDAGALARVLSVLR